MFRKMLPLVLSLSAGAAYADYNSNLSGNVTLISTYSFGTVLFKLSNQPTSNGGCDASFFEVDMPPVTANDAALNRMYARLAQAYATGETVNVGYDNAAGASPACGANGYIRVWRIG